MEYVTPAMMNLARQLRDINLDWPYGTGDHFCTSADKMQICLGVEQDGENVWVQSHGEQFALKEVAWLPKRTQALQWLMERGWKLTIQSNEKRTLIQAINTRNPGMPVEAFGQCELEALYDTMLRILDE